jgi:hypothetical protein
VYQVSAGKADFDICPPEKYKQTHDPVFLDQFHVVFMGSAVSKRVTLAGKESILLNSGLHISKFVLPILRS